MPEVLLEELDALDLEAMKVLVRAQQRKLASHETEIDRLKLLQCKRVVLAVFVGGCQSYVST